MLFNQENALYIYKYLMTQELSLHNNYPHYIIWHHYSQARTKPFLISPSFSLQNALWVLHKWNRYFTLRKAGSCSLHTELCIMTGGPCLSSNAADDRTIMIMWTDCQVCAARNKRGLGSAFGKWLTLCALRFVEMYSVYWGHSKITFF